MNERLKSAVHRVDVPPYLEARIRATLRSTPRPVFWQRQVWAMGMAAAMVLAVGVAYQLGHLRFTVSSQDSYIASVSNRVATLMRVGLRDHIHCAVFRKFPKAPPAAAELTAKLDSKYKALIPIVQKRIPEDYRLYIAHQCRYQGRQFVHFAMKNDSRLLSLVIARKGEGESFRTEELVPALVQADLPFYRASVQRFEIAAFESRDHLVYVISDMPEKQNMATMLALAPQLRTYLNQTDL